MVAIAKNELRNSSVKVASVATGFPSGQTSLALKLKDTKFAVEQGADEIDMVISRGKFLNLGLSFLLKNKKIFQNFKNSSIFIKS
jgi:deoxyribose-phosphate aldolase